MARLSIIALSLLAALSGCSKNNSSASAVNTCVPPTGTPWVPLVPGAGIQNRNPAVSSTQTTTTVASAQLNGWTDPMAGSRLVTVSIPMHNDLGPLGSLSLSAQVTGVPASLKGAFHPLLVSLNDGTHEYINLKMAGAAGDCADASGAGGPNGTSCMIQSPSAYQDTSHWLQHQLRTAGPNTAASASDMESMNVFPTCNWSGGSTGAGLTPDCPFNSTFFVAGKLPSGVSTSYTAKYFLLADPFAGGANAQGNGLTYGSIPLGYTASLSVTAVYKTNPGSTLGGAIDLNIILVGSQNVNDSRTSKGQQNLNLMLQELQSTLSQTATDPVSAASYSPGVKLGKINVVEWGCDTGGDAYATADPANVGAVLQAGSAALPASLGGAINVFLVSQFTDPSILGVDGAIGGTLTNGTPSSGMLVLTQGKLGTYNPKCTLASCPLTSQDSDFAQMGYTVAHELGHFFGLNHTSETPNPNNSPSVSTHDIILDTPGHTAVAAFVTTTPTGTTTTYMLTIGSVLNADTNPYLGTGSTCHAACTTYNSATGVFCPAAFECGFNHLMWWSSKNIDVATGTADGNLVSLDSAKIINYNPFVQ